MPALFFFLFSFFAFCSSCKDSDATDGQFNPNSPVEVTAIIPETGTIALPLVIHGKNFGTDKSKIRVLFDDVQAQIITAKNEHLYILTPRQDGGEHTVRVVVEDKEGTLNEKFNYIVTSSVSTIAGSGEYNVEDGNALEASFEGPQYIAIDDKGNLVASDYRGRLLRLVSLEESKVTTFLSNESAYGICFSPDYSILYAGIESSTKLANEFDCTSNWLRTIIPNELEIEYGSATVVTDLKGNVYYIGYKGAIARKNIDTDNIAQIGEIPEELINTEADGSGVDYYAAYNPHDNHIYVSTKWEHVIIRFEAKEALESKDFELYAGQVESGLYNPIRGYIQYPQR